MLQSTRTPEQVAAFEQALENGGSLEQAAKAAGYAPATIRSVRTRPARSLPVELRAILQKRMNQAVELGKSLTPEVQEALVRGGLAQNVLEQKDRAVRSLELLGRDRRVNMFTPENQTGVVVVVAPPQISGPELKPELESLEPDYILPE